LEALDDYLRELLGESDRPPGLTLYVFGSATRTAKPRDVDLLLIYADGLLAAAHAYAERLRSKTVSPPCDILVASETEATQLDLIARQRAIALCSVLAD
jgi:hypothetical protein